MMNSQDFHGQHASSGWSIARVIAGSTIIIIIYILLVTNGISILNPILHGMRVIERDEDIEVDIICVLQIKTQIICKRT